MATHRTTGTDTAATSWEGLLLELLSGGIEPEIEEAGDSLGRFFPKWLKKNRLLKRLFGFLKTKLENHGHAVGGVKGELLKRIADVFDFALQDSDAVAPETAQAMQAERAEWMADFKKNAKERFFAASHDEKRKVVDEVKLEAAMLEELETEAFSLRAEAGLPEVEGFDWSGFDAWCAEMAADIQADVPATRPRKRAASSTVAAGRRLGRFDFSPRPVTSGTAALTGTGLRLVNLRIHQVAWMVGGMFLLFLGWMIYALNHPGSRALGIGIVLPIVLIVTAGMAFPKIALSLIALNWLKPGTSRVWAVGAFMTGVLLSIWLFFLWLPVWKPETGEQAKVVTQQLIGQTVAWGVVAIILLTIGIGLWGTKVAARTTDQPAAHPAGQAPVHPALETAQGLGFTLLVVALIIAALIYGVPLFMEWAGIHRPPRYIVERAGYEDQVRAQPQVVYVQSPPPKVVYLPAAPAPTRQEPCLTSGRTWTAVGQPCERGEERQPQWHPR